LNPWEFREQAVSANSD